MFSHVGFAFFPSRERRQSEGKAKAEWGWSGGQPLWLCAKRLYTEKKNKGVYDDNNNNIGGLPFWKMRCVDVAFFLVLAHYFPTVF